MSAEPEIRHAGFSLVDPAGPLAIAIGDTLTDRQALGAIAIVLGHTELECQADVLISVLASWCSRHSDPLRALEYMAVACAHAVQQIDELPAGHA